MPDLTPVFYYVCLQGKYWHRPIGNYVVTFGIQHKFHRQVMLDFACNCKAYKYRPGYCKHIKEVQDEKCTWHQHKDGGPPLEKDGQKCCPVCEGPVEVETWMV